MNYNPERNTRKIVKAKVELVAEHTTNSKHCKTKFTLLTKLCKYFLQWPRNKIRSKVKKELLVGILNINPKSKIFYR